MVLQSGLSVWCYTAPGQSYYGSSVVDYSRYVEGLKFTTVAPGGFGQLTAKLSAANARIPRAELALFSRIAVMAPSAFNSITGGPFALFIGELTQPELGMDASGEYYNLQALGIGNCLRDDPRNVTYSAQTPQQIVIAEMTANNRANWMPLSTDQSLVFPDNPVTTFSPSYMGYSLEDILNDQCLLAGDYQWGVWAHPTQLDGFGFPMGQIQVHLRNSTVTNYQAFLPFGDIASWRITPSADRAYNSMQIYYTDPSNANQYGSVITTDSRLTGTLTQGTAPFRYRKYLQDFTGTTTVGATQASAIEAIQLAIMQNPTNKIQVVLKQVRNARGTVIPPWVMQADNTLNIPELGQRGQTIAQAAIGSVNLFYILSTEYYEDSSGNWQQTVQLDNWYDFAQTRLARLELAAYKKAMNGTTASQIQALGSPDVGIVGYRAYCASAGAGFGIYKDYHMQLAQTPTSITLSSGTTTNANSVTVSSISTTSFFLSWTAPAVGTTQVTRNYQTVGNCLLDVDLSAGTFAHHCEVCDLTRTGLSIVEDLRVELPESDPEKRHLPGYYALMVDCPCGASEAFHTGLSEQDERSEEHPHRAEQARLIRLLQSHEHIQQTLMEKSAKEVM